MRKYYALFFILVAVWASYPLTIPTKSFFEQSLQEVDQDSYANSEFFFDNLSPYGLLISFPVAKTSLDIYTNFLKFYLSLSINSKNFETQVSSKTVCS